MRSNALRKRNPLSAQSTMKSIPAPIGGWNARDALSEMDSSDAIYLDNLIPDSLGIRLRRGMTSYVTGLSGTFVESLMEWNVGGSTKFFAATPNKITNVTVANVPGELVQSGLSNGRWQHTMFATPGGDYLVACNGADAVRNYDGTTWTTPTINNVSSSTLINVTAHLSRLWFVKKDSLKVYYLAPLSIAGDATAIDFSSICNKGGTLIAMASWSRDGGSGLDDYAVFITSKGQVLVYQGTDPDSADTWKLVGVFNGPEPVGYRCFIKLGADLCLLSSQGVEPLPQYLGQSSAGLANVALTNKVSGAFKDAYLTGNTLFGWQILEYPKENLLICNVPLRERAKQYQFVMNLKTGAWCRFTGINAGCWGIKGSTLFAGGNDGVVRAYGLNTQTFDDDGESISALGIQAYNDYGSPLQKQFVAARPLMTGPQGYVPQLKMLVDFTESLPTFDPIVYDLIGPDWDVAEWDGPEWGMGLLPTSPWQTVTGTGSRGALALAAQVTTRLIWNQTDVLFKTGGVL